MGFLAAWPWHGLRLGVAWGTEVETAQPALEPAPGASGGGFAHLTAARVGGTFIEGHNHIGPQIVLDLNRGFGADIDNSAILRRFEGDAVFGNGAHLAQAKHLKAARIGQHGARPTHEAVEPPRLGHNVFARL